MAVIPPGSEIAIDDSVQAICPAFIWSDLILDYLKMIALLSVRFISKPSRSVLGYRADAQTPEYADAPRAAGKRRSRPKATRSRS